MTINQVVVDNTRQRTRNAWAAVGKTGSVPTPLLDIIAVLLQRIEDLEEQAGYTPADRSAAAVLSAMDTQGR